MTLLQAIETLLENYYAPEIQENEETIKRVIPCAHCLNGNRRKKVARFSYQDCVKSIASGMTTLKCPISGKAIPLHYLAPDISFAGIPIIEEKDLEYGAHIGTGGFGIVYKGLLYNHSPEPIEVAIKELIPPKDEQEYLEKFEEFKRESFIMSSLSHKNLVKLYGITVSPKLAMVMEFVRGGDLHHSFHVKDAQLEQTREKHKQENKIYEQEWKQFMENLANFGETEKQNKFAEFEKRKKALDKKIEEIYLQQRKIDEQKITWKLKYKVSLDIAKGIRYLHSITPPYIHRDLRSPNVFVRTSKLSTSDQLLFLISQIG